MKNTAGSTDKQKCFKLLFVFKAKQVISLPKRCSFCGTSSVNFSGAGLRRASLNSWGGGDLFSISKHQKHDLQLEHACVIQQDFNETLLQILMMCKCEREY